MPGIKSVPYLKGTKGEITYNLQRGSAENGSVARGAATSAGVVKTQNII